MTALVEYSESLLCLAVLGADWNLMLMNSASHGDIVRVKLAHVKGARMYEAALAGAERGMHPEICALLREWIATSSPDRIASLPPLIIRDIRHDEQ